MRQTNQLLPSFLTQLAPENLSVCSQQNLADRINCAHQQCQVSPATALICARDAGELLLQVQQELTPSQWQSWLVEYCIFSEKTAQTYMQIAQGWPKLTPRAGADTALVVKEQEILDSGVVEEPLQMTASLEPTPPLPPKRSKTRLVEKITFFIPGTVVPKARPRVTSHGTFLPPRYRAWRNHAELEIYRQISEKDSMPVLPIQRAAVKVRLIGKHRMNADADNILGSCLDALVAVGVFKNDNLSYIPEVALKLIPDGNPGAHITIIPLAGANEVGGKKNLSICRQQNSR